MIVNKICTNYSQNNKPIKNLQTSPVNISFYRRIILTKPVLKNEIGENILNKITKLIKIIPESSKMTKPLFVTFTKDGINKKYGIHIDKLSPNVTKIIIKDLSFNQIWEDVKETKDILSFCVDNTTGTMKSGHYCDILFNRDNKGNESISLNGPCFSIDDEKYPLGSIFWAMTDQNASVKI